MRRKTDVVLRELLIASEAARKLSVALHLAWAQLELTRADLSANARSTRGSASEGEPKNRDGANGPLPF